jgi:hypothetical protein
MTRAATINRGLTPTPATLDTAQPWYRQITTIYVPALNGIFKTEPLHAAELAAVLALAAVVFVAVEVEKWVRRWT